MQRLFIATLFAAACAPVLAVQSTQPPPSQDATQKPPVLTASGCLRNGEEPSTFVLTNVKWLDKTSAEKPSSVGTSGVDTGASGETVRLVGTPSGVRMSEHVGHTVEITGTLIDEAVPKPRAENAAPAEQSAQPPSQQPAPKSGHTMNVRTIKMIGESCAAR